MSALVLDHQTVIIIYAINWTISNICVPITDYTRRPRFTALLMMECLGCEMEVVCGQEGPMTEPTIIHVATHTLFLGSKCIRSGT